MELFKRLRASLFSPREVVQYRHDRWYVTVLYFIFLLVLSILPATITMLKSDLVTYEDQKAIKEIFSTEDIPFAIIDGVLIHKQNDSSFIYKKQIETGLNLIVSTALNVEDSIVASNINIIMQANDVYIVQSLMKIKLFEYDEYPDIVNLDLTDSNQVNNTIFWNKIFHIIDQELTTYKPYIQFFSILAVTFESLLNILLVSMILTIFQSFTLSGVIRFREIWKVCLYLLAPYCFGSVLSMIFNSALFYYTGFIITAIYIFMASRAILQDAMKGDNHEL
ncbi:MAG: DUF1189 family protein [Bacilli bacterium]|nr:DUF1189 family protein [Bacilli bacterium]